MVRSSTLTVVLLVRLLLCSGAGCGEYPSCGENCVPLSGACLPVGPGLAPWAVSCGSHRASSCSACLSECSGDCIDHANRCIPRTHPQAPMWFKAKQRQFRAYEKLPCAALRNSQPVQHKEAKGVTSFLSKTRLDLEGKVSHVLSRIWDYLQPKGTAEPHALHERQVVDGQDQWSTKAREVREAFLHAWHGYRDLAWGKDELRPLSKDGVNNFGGLAISILDSLTTLWLLDLPEEFDTAASFVEGKLDFGKGEDEMVSVFELTIRALGGLLGAHSLSGRPVFLERAQELAEKLLPAFDTPSGLPLPRWNLVRQEGSGGCEPAVLAEVGSVQLEWKYLSDVSGDKRFREVADKAFDGIQQTGVQGLLTVHLTPVNHVPTSLIYSKFATGGEIDSYYEYLLKQWLLNPKEERFKTLFLVAMQELSNLVRPKVAEELEAQPFYRLVELDPTGGVVWKTEHLSCFVPGMIALALQTMPEEDLAPVRPQWMNLAQGLMASCVQMWTSSASGLAPEHVRLNSKAPHHQSSSEQQDAKHSLLRPETAESLYYMYRLTGDEKYRQWGEKIFDAIVAHSKVDVGFAAVKDVEEVPTSKENNMPSFLLAETFKYLYLLFAPEELLNLKDFVLNTEAHPLRRALNV